MVYWIFGLILKPQNHSSGTYHRLVILLTSLGNFKNSPVAIAGKLGISVLCGVPGKDWLPEDAAATATPAASTAAATADDEVSGSIAEKEI